MKLKLLLSCLSLIFCVFSVNANTKSSFKEKDFDMDGVLDIYDIDDDNDGISDIDESHGYNPIGDIDNDGVLNYLDADFDTLNNHRICKSLDIDNDGIPNHLDLDSDNDGIPDNIEAQSTTSYILPSGKILENGIDSSYNNGLVLQDTDYDQIPDFIDFDSDNDGISDKAEIQNNIANLHNDKDGDGIIDYRDLFNINPPIEATMVFDGIDDYAEGPQLLSKFNDNNSNGITFMAWVKNDLDDTDTSTRFLLGEENAIELKTTGSKLEVYGSFKTSVGGMHFSNFSKVNGLKKGIWRHVTINVDFEKDEASIFLDGKWVHTRYLGYPGNHDIAGFYSELTTKSEKFMMGRQNKSTSSYYNGSIDEVRVFNEVLTEEEIQEIVFQEIENDNGLLKGKLTPNHIGNKTWDSLVLYYPMSNITCAKIDDKSNNENFAVIHNITTLKKQTAPMPFVTVKDGNWQDKTTWLYGDSWALPGDGISQNISYSDENYTWGIYHLKNDVKISSTMVGLNKFYDKEKVHALAIIIEENMNFSVSSKTRLFVDKKRIKSNSFATTYTLE